ncbi:sensor histidine kinase [Streptomyces bathyalis]|uniref:histidine kinase n=1 Tax=Streptomyces bathyalis TaxID=2710756 RepID=A0A7T1WS63_9ACTN|nr:sensor histidine kinase [Streptomyces bathyalis]QPP07269.1 sensor histidine kinase [Streptomyces bathyalis]
MHIARWSPLNQRALRELGYVLVALPIAVLGFVYAYIATSVGVLLSLTLIGLPWLVIVLRGARGLGSLHRGLVRLLGVAVTTPERVRRAPGVLGWIRSGLSDAVGWRTLAYLFLKGPLGVAEAVVVLLTWGSGIAHLCYPLWWQALWPSSLSIPTPNGDFHFDTWPRAFLASALGAVLLLAAPWVLRALLLVDTALLRYLLGPTASARRIQHLEETRAHAVEDSAQRLRRIEQDLHDGAQVRLVTLAMHLSAAKDRLAVLPTADPALSGLISGAHQNAKDALVELRSLVRGIHPPILDKGLDAALATLAASGSVPVRLRVTLPERSSPAIESIAYFCTAELLANVAKHSQARQAAVTVTEEDGLLRIVVRDDGAGGGRILEGGGLAGLAERLGTVDGRLVIDSPHGGPTVVTVELPLYV